ncbi:MAG TPA: RDD family protein [Candidatus Acidoferrales bacterium]|nr:RDD family protein [Candidatus Acidoferrales bacterium]
MFCSSCGRSIPEGATFCAQCGRPTGVAPAGAAAAGRTSSAAPPYVPPLAVATATDAPYPRLYYAGFWLRFVAYLIDSVILSVGCGILVVIMIFATGFIGVLRRLPENPTPEEFFASGILVGIFMFIAGILPIVWIYYAWMESSSLQGTIGKMALGLVVTDMQCRRVSFARASGRFWSKLITNLIPLWIGYIMAGFTAKKQALHDMIASCLVLRKA